MKTILNILKTCFMSALVALCINSCEDPYVYVPKVNAPTITDFSPKSGAAGTLITITGSDLQRIDQVTIGGIPALIKYRISGEEMVVEVLGNCLSGQVVVKNAEGSSTSAAEFVMIFLEPTVTEWPAEGVINSQMVIIGENLQVVNKIIVNGVEAEIIAKRENELVFVVPFSEEENVTLKLEYFDGENNLTLENEFVVLQPTPIIDNCPSSLTKYMPVIITGELLDLIETISLENVKLDIKSKSETEIVIDIPTNYFEASTVGDLVALYYNGNKQIVIKSGFELICDPNEVRYYKWTNILLSGRVPPNAGGTENAFFDAETGIVYHSCDAYDHRLDIDFYLYDQVGYVQFYSPANGTSTVKNYKCNNVSIDNGSVSWSDFYGTGGITTNFKVLSPDSANHQAVINAYETGTIVEINESLFAGIPNPGAQSPRVYKELPLSDTNRGTYLSADKNQWAWVINRKTGKQGILKVISMPQEPPYTGGRISDVIIDIIWQK